MIQTNYSVRFASRNPSKKPLDPEVAEYARKNLSSLLYETGRITKEQIPIADELILRRIEGDNQKLSPEQQKVLNIITKKSSN